MRAALEAALLAAVMLALATTPAHADKPLVPAERDINVVAFWSTSCAPCKDELPLLEALYRKYHADPKVRVVVVNIDPARGAAAARKLAAKLAPTVPQLTGGERIYERLFGDDVSIPRLAVVDRTHAGVERNGALAGEKAEAFVRDVSAAIESLRAGAPRPPTMQWAAIQR